MGCTLLVLLLVILLQVFSTTTTTTVSVSNESDDFAIWKFPCRRCKVYMRVSSGRATAPPAVSAAALPETPDSSGKKTNVGAVVGFTFLLVFILAIICVCIYRSRKSPSSPRTSNLKSAVVQPPEAAQELVQNPATPGLAQPGGAGRGKNKEDPRKVEPKGGRENDIVRPNKPKEPKDDDKVVGPKVPKGRGDDRDKVVRPKVPKYPENDDKVVREKVPKDRENDDHVGRPPKVPKGGEDDDKVVRPRIPDVGPNQGKEDIRRGEKKKKKKRVARRKEGQHKGNEDDGVRKKRVEVEKKEDDNHVVRSNKRGREGRELPLHEEEKHVEKEFKRERDGVERKDDVEAAKKAIREGKKPQEVVVEQGKNSLGLPKIYRYKYLLSVTNKFDIKNIIGGGTFGTVYRGTLADGTVVAVKCLRFGGRIDDFKNEVDALAKADHCNLVKLIGYCEEGITRVLVYEYMQNGSLEKWIFNTEIDKFFNWPEMKNIIRGIAQGLEYLHEKCEKKILHRDLKPANIILDENKNAKLCDFGLAKFLNKDQSSTSTAWAGTKGYMAPESKIDRISDKVDVYSFGAVVLEIMFGKRCEKLVTSEEINNVKEFKFNGLIRNLREDLKENEKEIVKFGKLAMFCLNEKPEKRPVISEVVKTIDQLEMRFEARKARGN